jgi:hypothetical protein
MTEGRPIPWRRPRTPAVTLILLSPLIGEVLNGATRISFIFAFVPQIMVWGCGALLIREAAQRWRAGWRTIVCLGLALSVIAEVVVLQTSVAPLPWLQMASIPVYDRVWGVNWLWFAFMLGYETVWIVLVPILITGLIFPEQRDTAWVRSRTLIIAGVVFVVGCFATWALWTQSAVPVAFHQPKYWPPRSVLLLGALGSLVLIGAAYVCRGASPTARTSSNAPSPSIAGIVAAVLAFPWWILIVLVFVPRPMPVWLPVLAAIIWASAAYLVVARWWISPGWNDRHSWALAFSALVVCMAMGYLGSSLWPAIDLIAKIALNTIAVFWMLLLRRIVWRRTGDQEP